MSAKWYFKGVNTILNILLYNKLLLIGYLV